MQIRTSPLIFTLSSGSKANCTFIGTGHTNILIDFGVSCKKAAAMLASEGADIRDIDAVFITHEHCDHVAGLTTLLKKYDIPVYITEPSYLEYIRGKGFELRNRLTAVPTEFTLRVGELTVSSFPVRHDSAACVAYKISGAGLSLGICTDAGNPTDGLLEFFSECGNVITEANYDENMLRLGTYPEEIKRRIMSKSGHTSNSECADFVTRLAEKGVRHVLLAHLSKENNTPELALYAVRKALKDSGQTLSFLGAAKREETTEFPVHGVHDSDSERSVHSPRGIQFVQC